MINSAPVGEGSDGRGKEPISQKHQWLVDHLDKYLIRSKVKDETLLFEKDNIKYYCEMEVGVNCLELILLGLIAEDPPGADRGTTPISHPKNLKKIIASLVEDVARHAIVVDHTPIGTKLPRDEDTTPSQSNRAWGAIEKEQFTPISEGLELQFFPPFPDEGRAINQPTIRLVQSSLKRNVKRRKAKPRYPVYMWILGSSHNKRIIPPRHATDFYYRLLEGKVGYPLNYLGACIKDLESQGLIEVIGKRLILSGEGAELAERLFTGDKCKSAIYWKVRVGHKKNAIVRA